MTNEQRTIEQWLPCPFCGAEAVEAHWPGHRGCSDPTCGAHMANLTQEQWNRRPTTVIQCGIRDAQLGKTCEPFDDPRSHDFQGWVEFDEGRGGTAVCTRCGISAFSHAMRYAP